MKSRAWLRRVMSGVEGALGVGLMFWAVRDALPPMQRFALVFGVTIMGLGLISWERYLNMLADESKRSSD